MTSPASSTWRSAGAILFCSSALLFLLYWPTVVSLVAMWRTSTYSYGAVIIPCAAYLVWSRRKRLAERALASAATSSRLRGGEVVTSEWTSRRAAAVTSSTARSNASALACEG